MGAAITMIVVFVVLANVVVMRAVIRSDLFDRKQKILQVVFIWLVPVLGATLCWYMAREPKSRGKRLSNDAGEEIGVDPGRHESGARAGRIGENVSSDGSGD